MTESGDSSLSVSPVQAHHLHDASHISPLHNTASAAAIASSAAGQSLAEAWPKGKKNYKIDKVLGTGATSKVYKAMCPLKNNMEIAMKIVDLDSSSVSMDELHRETQGMKKLRHENIVAYYGSFIENKFLCILMDLCDRSLLDMINYTKNSSRDLSHGLFDEHTIATIMREVLKGLQYIHDNGLVHRDIKCGNILLKKDGSVQIADFGVTAFINTNPLSMSVNPCSRHTFVGTPCWMAPEVMEQRQAGYTQKADIWSVGITALELVTGSAPYAKFEPLKVIVMTLNNAPPSLTTVEEKTGQYSAYGHKFRKFVGSCLIRDDSERAGAKQLLHHSFIKSKAKEKEYIVKALLSGDAPLPLSRRRTEDGHLIDESDAESGAEDGWQFPEEEPSSATLVAPSANPDEKLNWFIQQQQKHPGCTGISIKFRLRKRKDDHSEAGQPAASADTEAVSELQDITFDFAVGRDKANGITLELVESGLVSMHDMVVISRAMQTLVDSPWEKEKVFPLNSSLPPGVFADQNEFIGYAGLSVSQATVTEADGSEKPLKLVPCFTQST